MTSKKKTIGNIIFIGIGIFGLFIFLQIVKKIMGGSWTKEDISLGLATVNIGLTFALGIGLGWPIMELRSDFKHLKSQFRSFVVDFKGTKDNVCNLKDNVHNLKDDVHILKDNVHILKESIIKIERKLHANPK
jgi:predicted ThiF/HesA family dinucleotide-utilizing enzyme